MPYRKVHDQTGTGHLFFLCHNKDVYKRQLKDRSCDIRFVHRINMHMIDTVCDQIDDLVCRVAVSYTHLSKVHHSTLDQIHYHEVGSIDALVDMTGCAYLLFLLAPETILCSPVHVGNGFVHCAHLSLIHICSINPSMAG